MADRIEPELVELIEEIVTRRVREEMDARATLVTTDQFTKAMKLINKRFESVNKQLGNMDRKLDEISIGAGESFVQFCKTLIKTILAGEGVEIPFVDGERHFSDPNQEVNPGTSDIEVDLFCPDPAVIGEVTYKVSTIDKLDRFVRKAEFLEQEIIKGPSYRFFFTLEITPDLYPEFEVRAAANSVRIFAKEVRF